MNNVLHIVKLIVNFVIIIISVYLISVFWLLWVQPPIGETQDESLKLLKLAVFEFKMDQVKYSVVGILFIIFFNYLFEKLLKGKVNVIQLVVILLINIVVFGSSIYFGGNKAEVKLQMDIERNFK